MIAEKGGLCPPVASFKESTTVVAVITRNVFTNTEKLDQKYTEFGWQ